MLTPPAKLYTIDEFEIFFDPKRYFEHYYGPKRPDEFEKESWPFLIKTLNDILFEYFSMTKDDKIPETNKKCRLLQIGLASPGLLLAILTEKYFDEFYLADNCEKVRQEISNYLGNHSDTFNWELLVNQIRHKVDIPETVLSSVKNKIKRVVDYDVVADSCTNRWPSPSITSKGPFDAVATLFHIESRVDHIEKYFSAVKTATSHLKYGGFYVQGGMLNQSYYDTGKNTYFTSLPVSKQQVLDALAASGIEILGWNDFEVPYCNSSRTSTSPGASMYLCHGFKREDEQ